MIIPDSTLNGTVLSRCLYIETSMQREASSASGLEEFDILVCVSGVAVIFSFWSLWRENGSSGEGEGGISEDQAVCLVLVSG